MSESEEDTIRILVATDCHIGYKEMDTERGEDTLKTFHEIMCLAKEQDVDMVLLGGDLFDTHAPSRKSLTRVIESLRMNCLGDKPCEIEYLGDGSEVFTGRFNHVNYEDPDINVAIPVFSIHGNHDEPTGQDLTGPMDILQTAGLVNYFGKTASLEKIDIRPILLQKGTTKLALYGLGSVRDERLFRTFRNGNVKFYQPSQQKPDWFNVMVVHQNHVSRTPTGYLPENFLPEFLNLVIWGHEHNCEIEPRLNDEQGFYVSQPGSTVATQLQKGETGPKYVGLLSITGKSFNMDPIRLKTPRPFVMRDIVLADERAMKNVWKKSHNRSDVTRFLKSVVEDMIKEANDEWNKVQDEADALDPKEPPKPLLRIRVDYTAPEGGSFDCENPQRITSEFNNRIANADEVILFHKKKRYNALKKTGEIDMPEDTILEEMTLDSVKVEELVREFLDAQTLTVLPQNCFGDSVNQFVAKDDRHAMEVFVQDSLKAQVKHLIEAVDVEQTNLTEVMDDYRQEREKLFETGQIRRSTRGRKLKPQPDDYDSGLDGPWQDNADAYEDADADDDNEMPDSPEPIATRAGAKSATARGRGRGRGRGRTAATTTRKTVAAKTTRSTGRGRGKRQPSEEEEEEEEEEEPSDVEMADVQDDEDEEDIFVRPSTARKTTTRQAAMPATTSRSSKAAKGKATTMRQSMLDFSQPSQRPTSTRTAARKRTVVEVSDDDISDDDAFETPASVPARGSRRR